MSQRTLRVRELLKREIGNVMQRDYDFKGVLVTISGVDVTPDLRQAHVFIGVVGDPKVARRAVKQLNRDHGQIQRKINKRVVLKYSPILHFKLDDSIERGVRILSLIEEIPDVPDEAEEEEAPEDPAPVDSDE